MQYKETLSSVIRLIAAQYGYSHSNKFFQQKAFEMTGKKVSRQLVNQALGSTTVRSKYFRNEILKIAKELVSLCDNDKQMALKVISNGAV